mmetsp:Transcript_68635/g.129448  ORF Transcript_68635/g.129448 Transcript_68635/m.129448 type:complete len:143 (+) Transcript_68635:127-555(+)
MSGAGDISTHVISKLGKASIAGAKVSLHFNADFNASAFDPGWEKEKDAELSENGGNDLLVPPGSLKKGLYCLTYDFSGVDAIARDLFQKKPDGTFVQLNPTGFFLASKSSVLLKVEDDSVFNHVVVSVGDKEITIRPGVKAH